MLLIRIICRLSEDFGCPMTDKIRRDSKLVTLGKNKTFKITEVSP
jgi:hypothetical protein